MQHKKKNNKKTRTRKPSTHRARTSSQKGKTQHLTGILSVTKSGIGFFMHESIEEDIRIERAHLNTALDGDTVEIVRLPKMPRDPRHFGKVLQVVERAQRQFVGELRKEDNQWILVPDNKRVYTPFLLDDVPKDTPLRHKALVEFVRWEPTEKAPHAVIREVIGRAGEHETEMKAILLARGFVSEFPPAIEQEARALLSQREVPSEELAWRKDFRDVVTVTIDPHDAKDFDDALSIRTLQNGNTEVGVHIADVTHYVRPGTLLEKEAQKRGTSVYLVDRTIPMLPEVLSNDLCSLRPHEDRRAFAAVFELNEKAEVVQHYFSKTLIRSDHRFTYKSAQDVLDGVDTQSPFADSLTTLWALARKLRSGRVAAGAIEFESDEIQFELDAQGKPLKAYVKERLNTMKLIEEFMLLANRYVATHIASHSKGKNPSDSMFVYRIHDMPNVDKLAELEVFLRALGHEHLSGKDPQQIKAQDLAKLMRDIKGTPEEAVVQMATLRSMAKAVYSDKNIGHFSLGFTHYTHFTSPIRRYPDMMVHRILAAHLDKSPIPADEISAYRRLAIESSQREVEAVSAERESIKFKQVEYMHNRIGELFEGKVTGVTKGGMFIAETVTHAEGMVRMNSIPGDWFELNEKQYSIVGRKTGKTYRIGDTVRIRLRNVSLDAREIDWEIIEH